MSITSTGLSGEERRGGRNGKTPVLIPTNVDCIRSIRETAAILGIGEMSLRALIAKGLGPKTTRLSARRIGIKDSARDKYLASLNPA
jgi:hypothetical protein